MVCWITPSWPAAWLPLVTMVGGLLKFRANDTLLLGVSKLGVLETLKMSRLYLRLTRSVMGVFLKMERSARFWNGPRNRLRPLLLNADSKVSQALLTGSQGGTPSCP